MAEKATDAILKAAKTGQIGDDRIFIYDLDQTVRIRLTNRVSTPSETHQRNISITPADP
jgi:nitrogen regulatory protein PII